MLRNLLLYASFILLPYAALADEQLEPQIEQAAVESAKADTVLATDIIRIDREKLISVLKSGLAANSRIRDQEAIYNFYKGRDFEVFWTDGEKPSKRAVRAASLIEDSWKHGLNPSNYSIDVLKAQLAQEKLTDVTAFEILVSNAITRYGKDMTGMRVPAKNIDEDTRSWSKGWSAEQVLKYMTEGSNPESLFDDLVPPSKLYPLLQKELIGLIEDINADPKKDSKPIAFPGLIYPQKTHPTIKLVRARFDSKSEEGKEDFYDDALVEKVQKFQKESGLKADGIIGQRTIDALNESRRDRMVKIIANMERLRWMNPVFPPKYIIVNVPAMTLWAFEDEKIMFEMPVIVGKPDWPTTSFKTEIEGIRFNPSWYVPPSIKTKDLLPELQKNPDALTKKNLQLLYYTSDGAKPISPRDVNWSQVTEADLKNFAMIQNPGDENPLGKIRVLMPNQYNIYLHDTNSPDLFTKDYRALSHGCIRLAEPKKVAGFILDQNPDWNEERLNNILSKKNTIEVSAAGKIPVFILYQTIWQDKNGALIYGPDIYGKDKKLVAELASRNQLPVQVTQ